MATAARHDPLRRAVLHSRARVLAMPLFVLGVLGLAAALWQVLAGRAPWQHPLPYLAATGLSLGCFGLHNDTSLAMMVRAAPAALPPSLREELRQEIERHRAEVLSLVPMPLASWVVTALAVSAHLLAAWRLFAA